MSQSALVDSALSILSDLVRVRRTIHANPEVGLELPGTRQTVVDELSGLDVEVGLHERTSGLVAVVRGGDGPSVLLRADMDALPMPEDTGLGFASANGAMHACGHDLHTSMLLGAARLISERRDELQGDVVMMFQPGEEGHHGARWMLEEGLLTTLDRPPSRAFAIHVVTIFRSGIVALRPGPQMASADELRITVVGRGGHASMPHLAADPVPVAAEIVTAIETAITRRVSVFDPAVVTFGIMSAGTAHNVIPESAHLHGTIRALSEETRVTVHELVSRVAHGIADAHDVAVTVDIEAGYPVTVNNPDQYERVFQTARAHIGDDNVVQMPTPIMGAEDWSYVLQQVPGVMAFLGACPPDLAPETAPPNHSNRVDFDEAAMAIGAALYAAVALE